MKTLPVGGELFHADVETDTKLFAILRTSLKTTTKPTFLLTDLRSFHRICTSATSAFSTIRVSIRFKREKRVGRFVQLFKILIKTISFQKNPDPLHTHSCLRWNEIGRSASSWMPFTGNNYNVACNWRIKSIFLCLKEKKKGSFLRQDKNRQGSEQLTARWRKGRGERRGGSIKTGQKKRQKKGRRHALSTWSFCTWLRNDSLTSPPPKKKKNAQIYIPYCITNLEHANNKHVLMRR
jgi:hypothetical protein